jgi:uncharacterized membrane protein YgdD (TMEM256/DUF423 family)
MNRTLTAIAFLSGFLAVAIGAFGAHALKPHMTDYQLDIFKTASQYHFIHTLALLFVSWFAQGKLQQYAGWCFVAGIVLFSGSLYLLSLKNLLHIEHWFFLGPLTPLGGLFFLAGWALGLVAVLRKNKN